MVAQLGDSEQAERLWTPVIELGPKAHIWVESFLHSFISKRSSALAFSRTFCEDLGVRLIEHILDSKCWRSGRHFHNEDVQDALLAFDWGSYAIEDQKFAPAMKTLQPILARWAERWLKNDKLLAGFSRFLRMPSARDLVVPGLKWIESSLDSATLSGFRDDTSHFVSGMVSLLCHVWYNYRIEIDENVDFRGTFQKLLSLFVAMRAPGILQLHDGGETRQVDCLRTCNTVYFNFWTRRKTAEY